ncbi:peptidyl-prolyl cis-trans isomerase FKBP53 isoform X1 [Rhodamnia argentea]|uniref:peptidylprolyl isomerase n=1 Tax=Rhodamnia argentea TaxID=178133 RepID=A0ABM3HKL1_9MYRT|nr:peptidyl-prolyl cis-trans isomerase FKBP53 isoform X1 [Rhodamnia argentea]
MGFWGIEIKPGKKVNPFHEDNLQGRLHVTQATLGLGSSSEKSILQCFREDKPPIFLCTLLPNKIESCSLDLEFDDEDSVSFSVTGPKSIHLCGYLLVDDEDVGDECGLDSFGEDGLDTRSEESSEEFNSEDEYEDDYTDTSDDELFAPSSPRIRNSGVVIEEITEDDKPANGNPLSKKQKKNRRSDLEDNSQTQHQIVVRNTSNIAPVESEDEDGFPLSLSHGGNAASLKPEAVSKHKKEKIGESKNNVDEFQANNQKREVESVEQDSLPDRKRKRKKQKKLKEMDEEGKVDTDVDDSNIAPLTDNRSKSHEVKNRDMDQVTPEENQHDDEPLRSHENQPEKKKKKKKKKSQEPAAAANGDQPMTDVKDRSATKVEPKEQQGDGKPSQVRTFPNGLVIEELAMGKPDGRKAAPGKQVSVHYVGKLKKNGKIFDSNVGRAPFKFRLGIGQVIKGWDVGVNGMRIGDKRRLTIPPAMGYGAQGAGGKIPPNSWLVFDVELVNVH